MEDIKEKPHIIKVDSRNVNLSPEFKTRFANAFADALMKELGYERVHRNKELAKAK